MENRNITDGITTAPQRERQERERDDSINLGVSIASTLILLSLFAAYYFFG